MQNIQSSVLEDWLILLFILFIEFDFDDPENVAKSREIEKLLEDYESVNVEEWQYLAKSKGGLLSGKTQSMKYIWYWCNIDKLCDWNIYLSTNTYVLVSTCNIDNISLQIHIIDKGSLETISISHSHARASVSILIWLVKIMNALLKSDPEYDVFGFVSELYNVSNTMGRTQRHTSQILHIFEHTYPYVQYKIWSSPMKWKIQDTDYKVSI